MPGRSFNTSQTGYTALPPELLFDTLLPEAAHDPARQSGDGIPVLSVARLGSDWAGWAASDRAIVTLLDSATTSIHISAQSIKSYTPFLGDWPFEYIYAIGRALTRSVRVKIFLSSVGGSYGGDLPLDVITEIRNGIQNKTDPEITTLMQLLTVQSFPLPSKWSLPPTSPTSRGISNHAKVMVVDSRAVYIGSQNFYPTRPAWLSEFTYIFEDTTRAQQFVNSYFVPMETWCQPPPPLPAGARPVITQYQVTIVDLRLPWQAPDFFGGSPKYEVYLKHNDSRVWPTDNKYLAMSWLKLESVGITLPSFTSISNEQVMDIMDYNYIMSDDKLATFKFKPADLQKLVAGRNYEKRDSGYEMTYSFMSVVLP
jgi:phosphatidylserine/phosphatidylglycerophosphate/cardiolipin synthase-like enzyme